RLPLTARGDGDVVVVPLPPMPDPLAPQQYACPPVSSAHTWYVPATTCWKKELPATACGAAACVIVSAPSCPNSPKPQQYAMLSAATPQENVSPRASDRYFRPPYTATSGWGAT